MKIETLAVHAGHQIDAATGAVAAPITLSTTFERAEDGSFPHGYVYSRTENPNRADLEACLTALEGGAATATFGSGSAATAAIFQALAPGDHVIAPSDCYYGTILILRDLFARWNLEYTLVDMTDAAQVKAAIRPNTRLIWIETPSNPLLKVTDIAEIARLARDAGALCACDNTWATPVLQRPFELGADLSVHATTKYLGGHSDVTGGAVVSKADDEFFKRIKQIQKLGGAVPSPFDCWLILRGIRTLPYRMRGHSENALKIAQFLANHSNVEAVHYPGLPDHPAHIVAARQMSAFGGMLSFQVRGGRAEAFSMAARLRIFTRATSLGATESLIEHRASIEGPQTTAPENLLRVSVGLEHPDDLIDDLAQALA